MDYIVITTLEVLDNTRSTKVIIHNKLYFILNSSEHSTKKYVIADLYFSNPVSGKFVKDFDTYEDALLFWDKHHNNFIRLSIVHNGNILRS